MARRCADWPSSISASVSRLNFDHTLSPRPHNLRRLWVPTLLWSAIMLCCGTPLIWMAAQVITAPDTLTELRWGQYRIGLLTRTILYNSASSLLAVLMSVPAALVVGRGRGAVPRAILFLLPVAVIMPSITYTYGWMQVFRLASINLEPAGAADVLRCIWTLAC